MERRYEPARQLLAEFEPLAGSLAEFEPLAGSARRGLLSPATSQTRYTYKNVVATSDSVHVAHRTN